MTITLERIFFAYILRNKNYFEVVLPHFFKNPDMEFVYRTIRQYMVENSGSDVPSPKQIAEMVFLEDTDKRISKDILRSMLKVELAEYDEDKFIRPKLTAWILINRVKGATSDIIDESRMLESVSDLDSAIECVNKIKAITDEATAVNFEDDDDLGADFDDPEEHIQDHSQIKVKTGWESLDHVLGGGWDISTFNCIMGETNSGKSLWMQNFAVNSANMGYNVLYITLEMSVKKTLKRLGSMRLRVPIDKYDDLSNDTEFMKKRIDNLHKQGNNSDLFTSKSGKIITKFYPAGTATIQDFDVLLKKIKERKGLDINMVVVDYITLMAPVRGLGIESNLYLKGKHLAEGLRAIAAKYELTLVTGMQIAKDAWNSTDITLDKIPESKAIAETADTFFAIIRTEEMKRQNIYRLKMLKQRDGDFSKSQIKFDLNPKYLTIENDIFLDAAPM